MRVIIAEDELEARRSIGEMARAYGLEVVAECQDGDATIHSLQQFRADLLFLDIQMPGIDGFGVLKGVEPALIPGLIFTTAYDQYAVRAFEHNALDYLLKPFDDERFRKAVDRARLRLASVPDHGMLIHQLLAEFHQSRPAAKGVGTLVVRSRGKIAFVKVEDIDWIEASGNYLKVHIGTEVHSHRATIAEIESQLDSDKFLRIHRSLIVNVDRIRHLESCGYGEYLVVLRDGKKLSLSRGYRERLDRFVENLIASGQSASGQSLI